MKLWFKRVVVGLLLVLLLALAGAAVFVLTFNPNQYKYKLEELVSARYQRTLAIQGDIQFALFPRIAVAVSDVSLSERGSHEAFASVEAARFSIALWPLLFNRLLVDHVAIDGLRARVQRNAAGTFNFDDLLQPASVPAAADTTLLGALIPVAQAGVPPKHGLTALAQEADGLSAPRVLALNEPEGAAADKATLPAGTLAVEGVPGDTALQIDIAGIELKDSEVFYEDAVLGYSQRLYIAQLLTGRMTLDQAFDVAFKGHLKGHSPSADLALDGQGQLFFDPRNKLWAAQKVALRTSGNWNNVQADSASLRGNLMVDGQARTVLTEAFDFSLKGSAAGATPVDKLELDLAVPKFKLGYGQQVFELDKLVLRANAEVSEQAVSLALDAPRLAVAADSAGGEPVLATLKVSGDSQLGVSLQASGLGGTADKLQLKQFKLEGRYKADDQQVQLDMSTPIEYIASEARLVLTALMGELATESPSRPEAGLQFPLIGTAMVDWHRGKAEADLNAVLGGGPLNLKFSSQATEAGKPPKLAFKLAADTIRLDQFLPAHSTKPHDAATGAAQGTQGPDAVTEASSPLSAAESQPRLAPEPALPVLHALDLTGDIQIGSLFYDELLLQNVKSVLRARDGKLLLSGFSADVYEGKLKADLSLDSQWKLGVQGSLTRAEIGPLLKAVTGKNRASGRGTLSVNVRTQGPGAATLAQQFDGNVILRVTEGAIYGLDLEHLLAGMAHNLPSIAGGASPVVARMLNLDEKTGFSLLDAHLQFAAGQGNFKRLVLDSPVFQVRQGKPADIDLVSQRINLLAQLKVLSVPNKAEHLAVLAAFRGLTVPLFIAGPLGAPTFTLQWQGVKAGLLKNAGRAGLSKLLDKPALPLDRAPVKTDSPGTDNSRAGLPQAPAPADKLKELGKSLKGLLK